MRVVFLGTGAGMPTAQRNPPCMALELGARLTLFDCGEGTLLRLRAAGLKPFAVETVCLSHLHGDHVNGLPGLIGALSLRGHKQPLRLCGPQGLADYVACLRRHDVFYPSFELELVELASDGEELFRGTSVRIVGAKLSHRVTCVGFRFEELCATPGLDLAKARAAGVADGPLLGLLRRGHDVQLASGKVVRSADVVVPPQRPRVLAYCSDTAPCDNVRALARDADLLVHEATYAAKLRSLAHERGHSTSIDAAEAAKEAQARALLLTHFSPRYKNADELVAEARAIFPNSNAAEELGSVTLRRRS